MNNFSGEYYLKSALSLNFGVYILYIPKMALFLFRLIPILLFINHYQIQSFNSYVERYMQLTTIFIQILMNKH